MNSLKPGSDATDYAQALRGAEGLFKETAAADKRIVLISDFQAAGRSEAEASYRLPSDIKLVTIDVGEQNSPNLAITDVVLRPMIYQAKYEDKLTARIANFSDEYSVWKPPTSSPSASGRSKGARLVSPTIATA